MDETAAANPSRRDFIFVATATVGVVGAAFAVWPLINQMNPDAAALALATIEVDVGDIAPGMSVTVKWRGKPVFIRNRTDAEIEEARAVPLSDLKDQSARNDNLEDNAEASDANRTIDPTGHILVMIGVCTHLGCVPIGQSGDFGGWFCPCHGSHYDTAGRVRKGPAPQNLEIPALAYISDTVLRIG